MGFGRKDLGFWKEEVVCLKVGLLILGMGCRVLNILYVFFFLFWGFRVFIFWRFMVCVYWSRVRFWDVVGKSLLGELFFISCGVRRVLVGSRSCEILF